MEAILRAWRRWLKSGAVVFDVGANCGLFVRGILDLQPAARVHAFEPDPEPLIELSQLAAEQPGVIAIATAVTDKVETRNLYCGRNSCMSHLGNGRGEGPRQVIKVRTTTLDTYAAQAGIEKVDAIKMDVEGFEGHVVRGASKVLAQADLIAFEWGSKNQSSWKEMMHLLDRFVIVRVDAGNWIGKARQ